MSDIAIRVHAFVTMLIADLKKERGQDLIEYALLGGGIAAAMLLGFLLFDDAIASMVNGISECIDFDSVGCNSPFDLG